MKVVDWAEFVAARGEKPLAVTIGVFDGVHRGHQRLMETVLSRRPAMECAAITFVENPKKVLHPQTYRGSIFTLPQKLDAFAAAGFDLCVLIDFSLNFGTLSGAEFLSRLAFAGVKFVCVGPNFRCGHKMDTNAQALVEICRSLGVEAEIVEPVLRGGHPVSSSRIRNAILEGRLDEAAEMLGRPYTVEVSRIDSPSGEDRALLAAADAVLPPEGVYEARIPGAGERLYEARVERGAIFLRGSEIGDAGRVAILNVVSRRVKEI